MEGVEDIPGTALHRGHRLGVGRRSPSTSTPLDVAKLAVDVGVQVPHGAVRAYAMGERGAPQRAGDAPRTSPRWPRSCRRRSRPGALGFSTSRTLGAPGDATAVPCPARSPAEDELFALGHAMKRGGRSVFELAPLGAAGEDLLAPEREMGWMRRLSDDLDLPVSFTLLQIDAAPDAWRGLMDESLQAYEAGAQVVPQIAGTSVRDVARVPHPSRLQRAADVPRARGAPGARGAPRGVGEARGTRADPRRGRRRAGSLGALRRHVPAGAVVARPSLRARATRRSTSPRPIARSQRWPMPPASIPSPCSTT